MGAPQQPPPGKASSIASIEENSQYSLEFLMQVLAADRAT